MNQFCAGHFAPVAWQAEGGTAFTLQIKDHNIELSVLLHDVTHTGTLGVRARLTGPLDAAGAINADLDLDLPPYGPVALFPGYRGIAAFGFTLTRALQIPCSIEKLRFQTAVDKEVMYGFDVKMNALAGFVIFPAL